MLLSVMSYANLPAIGDPYVSPEITLVAEQTPVDDLIKRVHFERFYEVLAISRIPEWLVQGMFRIGRYKYNGNPGCRFHCPDEPQKFRGIERFHIDIDHHEVRRNLTEESQGLEPVCGLKSFVFHPFQQKPDVHQDDFAVVDNNNLFIHVAGLS
jgi:hypothetical protein